MGETLRVNGRGTLTRDPELLEDLPTGGTKPPRLALDVEVDEAYLHCPKAFLRGGVWDPSTWTPAEELPVRGRDLPRPPRHARADRRADARGARREHPRTAVVSGPRGVSGRAVTNAGR
jgi:hypothetical protein